ncbi:MAG: mechanosensitive ion channel family protein [Bifidobacterium crudilactis]|jgi:small-conductance mechanosensitive channel|nr:mechanosensitive ion channel family protein [Bifidobacterium crudilactis]MCI1889233.1 mechanosensitive ion channel family protein [Bifidobacterium crudilactis]
MEALWEAVSRWLAQYSDRIIIFAVTLLVTVVITKIVGKALQTLLDRSQIPSATIFVNIVLAVIWIMAAMTVMQPVFGVNPTTFATALGVSGIALSFGLKDTIANIVGGFGLMMGKVIQPGDVISIAGTNGTVKDVTWRHTIVTELSGNEMWIPNSVLNTASLEKLTLNGDTMIRIPMVIRGDSDPDETAREILALASRASNGMTLSTIPSVVRFQGFTPYGVSAELWLFAKPEVLPALVQDAVVRSLVGQDFLVQDPSQQTA